MLELGILQWSSWSEQTAGWGILVLTVVLLSPNTGTPNTVVYFGNSGTLLVFLGQVTLVVGVVVDVVDPVDVTVVIEQLNWRSA